MLDPKIIRNYLTEVANKIKTRGLSLDTQKIESLEEQRKILQTKTQDLQNERNKQSKAIGQAKASGQDVNLILDQIKNLGDDLKKNEDQLTQVQLELNDLLIRIPNIPHESVPIGKSEEDNKVIRLWGEPPTFEFTPQDHVDLGAKNNWMDFKTASKLTGARFVALKGPLARLQRGLIQFMLDVHIKEHGYQEIAVPYLVNADSLFGTGQLPSMKEDLFCLNGENEYYLIPTAEVPVTNTVRDEIVEITQLPVKYVCYSSCFRSEAGSYGKDTRGMLRQHQFEKVEIVQIVHPEKSFEVHEELTNHAEKILQKLELPYRVVALCTGDLGFSSAKTYDLEVWLPGQNRYREISSCSNMTDFQARRMKARFRDPKTGKTELVHTLNGSGLAVGRTLIAILENFQDAEGNIHLPKVLHPYMDGMTII